jgi:hypothetical protein
MGVAAAGADAGRALTGAGALPVSTLPELAPAAGAELAGTDAAGGSRRHNGPF